MSLTPEQLERYARHIMLREIGGPGQRALLDSCAVIVGAGALGGPVATYLAAAGVGKLRIIDDDLVSLSNLQRQVQFATSDIGRPKGEVAVERLTALNPGISVTAVDQRLTAANAAELLAGADVVVDGTDSFKTRFDVNMACHGLGITLVSGAVGRWSAQVSVFKSGGTRGKPPAERLPCYRCFVPDMPETEETCAMVGVMGPLTGMVGSRMALEAVKEITGAGQTMAGRVWLFDGLSGDSRTVKLTADPACPVCGG
ncbi:MAG: HesA/MoeB/ThiF family protein [Hyphomonadaceae bacterium]|nr:HesA/MoeB/ThiF family protein [Hyphomonadaceae bacterium]